MSRPAVEGASGLWRSEDVCKLTVIMQREAVHETLFHLGREGIAQFVDMQRGLSAFQRPFTNEIRRCDDLERRLRYIAEQMAQRGVVPKQQTHETSLRRGGLDALELLLEKHEKEVRDITASVEQLRKELSRTREFNEVLRRNVYNNPPYSAPAPLNDALSTIPTSGLQTVAGVIVSTKIDALARLVFRVSRGNCFVRTDEIEEPFDDPAASGGMVEKSVFIVYGSSKRVMERVQKVCDTIGATTYPMTNEAGAAEALRPQMETLQAAVDRSDLQLRSVLERLAATHEASLRSVHAEKSICAIMNLLEYSGPLAKAQVWIPTADRERLINALAAGASQSGAAVQSVVEDCEVEPGEVHPTFFHTTEVLGVFQGIVDSYGIARYKEINPGVFTIITFPYLFGIMYGDIGHGTLLTLFAAFLIAMERRFQQSPQNEIFAMIFGGRYLLLLMGLFAVYVGMLYNDFFGFSLSLFESAYTWPVLPPEGPRGIVTPTSPNGHPNVAPERPYAFGIDVAWSEADNKLEFYNSVKMKCAVIVGVVQMTVGLFLSLMNHIHNRDYKKIAFAFIPEFIFLMSTFGYMSILIVVKWCTKWENTHLAPSLLETMTNFFLSPGTVSAPLYEGQAAVQVILLLLAFAQVPIMLLVIPFLESRAAAKQRAARSGTTSSSYHDLEARPLAAATGHDTPTAGANTLYEDAPSTRRSHHSGGHGHGAAGDFDFGEVMIHYIIHTIEFVLGCVSNTASYLRLWALSLAHAELSEVFLNFGLLGTLTMDNGSGIMLMIGFGGWLGATLTVLLMMESLSAFLHALRLHWVEFQGKFYGGDGRAFEPFSLREELNLQRHD